MPNPIISGWLFIDVVFVNVLIIYMEWVEELGSKYDDMKRRRMHGTFKYSLFRISKSKCRWCHSVCITYKRIYFCTFFTNQKCFRNLNTIWRWRWCVKVYKVVREMFLVMEFAMWVLVVVYGSNFDFSWTLNPTQTPNHIKSTKTHTYNVAFVLNAIFYILRKRESERWWLLAYYNPLNSAYLFYKRQKENLSESVVRTHVILVFYFGIWDVMCTHYYVHAKMNG